MSVGESRPLSASVYWGAQRASAMAVASAKAIISTLPESFFQGDSVTAVDGGGGLGMSLTFLVRLLTEGWRACLSSAKSPDRTTASIICGKSI